MDQFSGGASSGSVILMLIMAAERREFEIEECELSAAR